MSVSSVVTLMVLMSVCVVSPQSGTEGAGEERPPERVLHVCYLDQAHLDDAVRDAMSAEVRRVFGEIGIEVRGLSVDDLSDGRSPPSIPPLRVLLLDRDPRDWGLESHAMGVMMGGTRSVVYAFAPPIRRTLDIADSPPVDLTDEEIGRAFARVVIHEIVHAYAPDHAHTGWGLMGHRLDADTLTQPRIGLAPEAAKAFVLGWERLEGARRALADAR